MRPPRRRGGASGPLRGNQASDASSVISMPVSACETGQPVLAPSAIVWNSSALSPGTTASTFRWLPVIPLPGMKVTDAVVSTLSGGVPFSLRACERAMLKHDECAAAMSSSGVVTDVEPSLRAFQLTGKGPWLELSRAISPDPSVRLPFHEVLASLVTLIVFS